MKMRAWDLISQWATTLKSSTTPFCTRNPIFATSEMVNENGRVCWYPNKEHLLSQMKINSLQNRNRSRGDVQKGAGGAATLWPVVGSQKPPLLRNGVFKNTFNLKAFCNLCPLKIITKSVSASDTNMQKRWGRNVNYRIDMGDTGGLWEALTSWIKHGRKSQKRFISSIHL